MKKELFLFLVPIFCILSPLLAQTKLSAQTNRTIGLTGFPQATPNITGITCNNWLYLPSAPSYVDIGQLNIPGDQLTVEANINLTTPIIGGSSAPLGPSGPSIASDIAGKYKDPSDVNYLLRVQNAQITTTTTTPAGTTVQFYKTPDICDNIPGKTYHVAMVYDGSSLKYYRNGFLMVQIPATGNLVQNSWSAQIGYYFSEIFNTNFIGYINEVRIWNVARTQSQIQAYMNTSLPSPATQTGLQAYYTFDNLLNKQGNPAWNGTLNGSASFLATNPTCAAFVPDNDCCPLLQGTLTGSTGCPGVSPTLTFTATNGTGPFTLTYTDGINTNTQSNVQSGVPFVVPNVPAGGATYTLISIQDASGCAATPLSGLSTGGNTIVNGDFSNGNSGFASGYGYSTSGLPAAVYFIGSDPVAWNPGMSPCHDHTTGSGNMMLVNGADQPNVKVWTETIPVTPNTDYQFSTWLESISNLDPALLQFSINGTTLGSIFQANSSPCTWNQFYTTWNSANNTSATISILNMNQDFTGNDFALDDIYFAKITAFNNSAKVIITAATASFNATSSLDSMAACEGSQATLYGAISPATTGLTYQWQQSSDSGLTWTNIPNSNSLQLNITLPVTGKSVNYQYKMLATNGSTPNPASCNLTSNLINFTLLAGPPTDFVFDQSVCNPLNVTFSGPNLAGPVYVWTIDGVNYPGGANLVHNFSQLGTYPVKLKATDALGCADSTTGNITVQMQYGKIINTIDSTICVGHSIQLSSTPALGYCWTPAATLDNSAISNPTASPTTTTTYYLTSKTTGTNLIVNGDFSNGNTGFTSAYVYDPVNVTEGEYFVGTNPHNWNANAPVSCGDHTTGSGNMMMVNGDPTAGVGVWQTQTLNVTPNTNYAFSAWIESISPNNPAVLQFSINGHALGNSINANPNTCTWNQFYTVWNSGSSTTAVISLLNQNTNVLGNDFALDDISFAPVMLQQDSVIVTIENTAVSAFPDTSVCPGSPVTLKAVGSLAVSPYTYSWTPSAGLSDSISADPIALPSVTTNYTVTATTTHGCTATASVLLNVFPGVTIGLTPDTTICPGTNLQLQVSGGIGYSWTPSQYLDNSLSSTPQATPDTTRFFVTVTDGNNCSAKDSVLVRVRPPVLFNAPSNEEICKGYSIMLKSNNSETYVYNWSPADGLSDPSAPFPTAGPVATSVYTVNISDPVCGHDSTFNVSVTVKPSPNVQAQKANDIDCAITTSQLSATGAVDYRWTPEEGLDNPGVPNPIASIDSTTTFVVQGTDENGCSAFDTVTVRVTATGHNRFVVPNAFTPNGDGRNDCFGIRRWGDVRVEEFSVYNRWGGRVFTTRNPSDCWDGTFNGQPQEAGSYVYIIRAWSFCGEITRKGAVMLIR